MTLPGAMQAVSGPVRALAGAFAECWNRHDMVAFGELFAEDADFVNVYGVRWQGRAAIVEAHRATHATIFRTSTLELSAVYVRALGDGAACVRCAWRLDGLVMPDGQPVPARRGYLTHVVQRQADGPWRIVVSQNTDIAAPA